jgi:hypothetical protein
MAIVVASQVGSSVGLKSLEDLNQPNILADNLYSWEKREVDEEDMQEEGKGERERGR